MGPWPERADLQNFHTKRADSKQTLCPSRNMYCGDLAAQLGRQGQRLCLCCLRLNIIQQALPMHLNPAQGLH